MAFILPGFDLGLKLGHAINLPITWHARKAESLGADRAGKLVAHLTHCDELTGIILSNDALEGLLQHQIISAMTVTAQKMHEAFPMCRKPGLPKNARCM